MFIPNTFDAIVQDAYSGIRPYFLRTANQIEEILPTTYLGRAIIRGLSNNSEQQNERLSIISQIAVLVLVAAALPSKTSFLVIFIVAGTTTALTRIAFRHFLEIAQWQGAMEDVRNID